ncbi:MAG: hypothetical protein WDN06_05190 [Asticcacaulis sp.]
MSYASALDAETYRAPYPPQPRPLPYLTISLATAVVAINLVAGLAAWRVASLSAIDPAQGTGANALAVLPPPGKPTKLAVLEAPGYIPAGKYVPVKAVLTGGEAAAVIDAIDPDNDAYDTGVPCISCDIRLAPEADDEAADIEPTPQVRPRPEPVVLMQPAAPPPTQDIPYTVDDTPAN